jgi:chemotaxis-related protein WspD
MNSTTDSTMLNEQPMNHPSTIHDCWNTVGVWGNSTCAALKQHIHCRNCPVHGAAAVQLLDRELPDDYRREWTNHIAAATKTTAAGTKSVVIFRIAEEWLALPTRVFQEVAEQCSVRTVPHRRRGNLLGLVNIRGELLLCASLGAALGLVPSPTGKQDELRRTYKRLLVVNREGSRLAFPVDEVSGVYLYHPRELKDIPATLAKAAAAYTIGLLAWNNTTVGCLDAELLFYALNKSFS